MFPVPPCPFSSLGDKTFTANAALREQQALIKKQLIRIHKSNSAFKPKFKCTIVFTVMLIF
jgi:hypothetical protein